MLSASGIKLMIKRTDLCSALSSSTMSFKLAVLLAAATFCVVEAASVSEHARTRRSVDLLISNAVNAAKNAIEKVKDIAQEGLDAATNVEHHVLSIATNILQGAGVDVDMNTIVDIAKGNVKDCANTATLKSKATKIRNSILSCVAGNVKDVESAVKDVQSLLAEAANVPALLSAAAEVCNTGNFIDRIRNCASAMANVVIEGNLAGIPALAFSHISTITGIFDAITSDAPACMRTQIAAAGPALLSLSQDAAMCVQYQTIESAGDALASTVEE